MAEAFRCPHCQHRLKMPREQTAQVMRCPHCDAPISFALESPRIANSGPADRDHVVADAPEAPISRPGQKIDHEDLIDMTAMVDIVFFLLIFFLVTSMSAIQSSAPLPRPESQDDENGAGAQQQLEDPQKDSNAIVVKINKDDSIEIDGVPYRELSDLVIRLRQLRTSLGADASLLIVGHGDASHGTAVSVLDSGYEVGFDRLRLAVLGENAD